MEKERVDAGILGDCSAWFQVAGLWGLVQNEVTIGVSSERGQCFCENSEAVARDRFDSAIWPKRATACPLWDKQCPPARAIIGPSQCQEHCFCEDSEAVAHLAFQRYSLRENDPHVTGIGRKPASVCDHP